VPAGDAVEVTEPRSHREVKVVVRRLVARRGVVGGWRETGGEVLRIIGQRRAICWRAIAQEVVEGGRLHGPRSLRGWRVCVRRRGDPRDGQDQEVGSHGDHLCNPHAALAPGGFRWNTRILPPRRRDWALQSVYRGIRLSYRARVQVGAAIPGALADAIVRDAADRPFRLGDAWSDRDALVIFVRHFACAGCAEHVAALRPRLDELARLDTAVIAVGCGTPDQLAGFVEREQLPRCYTDPGLGAYRAAGLVRSWRSTYGLRALLQLARARLRGFSNGRAQGDPLQQGGTLYVARGGELCFYDRAEHTGDHAPLVDVVDVALARRAIEAAS